MRRLKRWGSGVLVAAMLLGAAPAVSSAPAEEMTSTLEEVVSSASEIEIQDAVRYTDYREAHADAAVAAAEIWITAENLTACSDDVQALPLFEGKEGESLRTGEEGFVEFTFEVETAGLYAIEATYFTVEGKTSSIVRRVEIDGEVPFQEMENITWTRVWKNETDDFETDASGNEIRPSQVEIPCWNTVPFSDAEGMSSQPFLLYFSTGIHTLRLTAVREPTVLHSLRLYPSKTAPPYEEYRQEAHTDSTGQLLVLQGEAADRKSDSMLYPSADRSSASAEPSDPARTVINTIGGNRWNIAGQWVEWDVDVKQAGYYVVAIKFRQNQSGGLFSSRSLTIDGKAPFSELETLTFPYGDGWTMVTLGGEEPYRIYLDVGIHRLRLTAVLGVMGEQIEKATRSLTALNTAMRQVLMITGPDPDEYRDYAFERTIPEALDAFKQQADVLQDIETDIIQQSGGQGENTQILRKLYRQLRDIADQPRLIARQFSSLRSNISALGTWLSTVKSQPLEIDYLVIASPDRELPELGGSFFENLAFHFRAFIASFFNDYSGQVVSGQEAVTVWVGNGVTGGRDQVQVLRQLINSGFTEETGIPVNLQLVSMGALMPAISSGKGPDIALTLGASDPINYAIRDAVLELSTFQDFDTVAARFSPSALTPLTFQGQTYGLPESQTFPMLFYRKDILAELGVSVPETWEDVKVLLPILQKKQMNFGMPNVIGDTGVGMALSAFSTFLLQSGGTLYEEDGSRSALDSDLAIEVFDDWVQYYTDYDLPTQYDFANRFRTGEIPIAIADYGTYNQLSVFAPEIKGLWDFTLVPGTRRADGTVDHTVAGSITACVILKRTILPKQSWEFLKWWTSQEVQVTFGRELESIMGVAARYATANLEAMEQLPWSASECRQIQAQWQWVQGIPEVPGGYFTPRHFDFAFRDVLNDSSDPGETLEDAVKIINAEITAKRREFHIEDAE